MGLATHRFPECQLLAVHLPERFRGGCAFGVGAVPDLFREDQSAAQSDSALVGEVNGLVDL